MLVHGSVVPSHPEAILGKLIISESRGHSKYMRVYWELLHSDTVLEIHRRRQWNLVELGLSLAQSVHTLSAQFVVIENFFCRHNGVFLTSGFPDKESVLRHDGGCCAVIKVEHITSSHSLLVDVCHLLNAFPRRNHLVPDLHLAHELKAIRCDHWCCIAVCLTSTTVSSRDKDVHIRRQSLFLWPFLSDEVYSTSIG